MRRRRIGPEARPLRNIARSPRFAGYSTAGQGKISNDRFTGNVTYTDRTGISDGPTLPDGTVLTRVGRLTVTTSRTRLGFHVADIIENASPTPSKQFDVTPGEQILLATLVSSSVAATFNMFARGSNNSSAWVDGASVSLGGIAVAANTYTWVWGIYTVPAGVTKVGAAVWSPTALANGVTVDCAAILAARSRVLLPKYGDGYFTDWKWTGTTNDSESVGWAYTTPAAVTSPWRTTVPTLLPYSPPFDPASPPAGTKIVIIDDTPAKRHIDGAGGRVLLNWPSTPVSDIESVGTYESLVTVSNFSDLVSIGGHITINRLAPTTLTSAMTSTATSCAVISTAGFPATGMLRIEGESMRYASKDATNFLGLTRQSGFFNDSAVSSNGAHPSGAIVYISERHRTPIGFADWTGTAHVEGLLLDGFVCDGPRASGHTGKLRLQRCRVDAVTNYDTTYETDGHPDGVQAYDGGCAEIDIAQMSIVLGPNGNGIINKGSNGSDATQAVPLWRGYDWEIITKDGSARSLVANSDGAYTTFDLQNAWLRYAPSQTSFFSSGASLRASFNEALYRDGQIDIVPAETVGSSYVSPGYS